MSDGVKAIVARLARLQQFADLFQHELQEVGELVKAHFISQGGAVDPLSTSPEEMQVMLAQLEQKGSKTTATIKELHNKAGGDGTEPQRRYMSYFTGPNSALVVHLAADIIEKGKGDIRPGVKLMQYEESATESPATIVKQWPTGFYRNQTTKEMQLLIQLNHATFIFDGLPGNDGHCYLIDHTLDTLRAIHELAEEERHELMQKLDAELILIEMTPR